MVKGDKMNFFRMCLNLSDHQPKIECYIHRVLYMNLMVTTNQKPTKDTLKVKKKECKHNKLHIIIKGSI